MKEIKKIWVLVFLLTTSYSLLSAIEVIPVCDFQLLSGQYFYNSEMSNLSGNLFFNITPAVKFSDKLSILPGFTSSYKATKQTEDLAGGGTLFQDVLDNTVSTRFIYKPLGFIKTKILSSYKLQYRRETRDEKFGTGLFDYNKLSNGFEAELSFLKNYSIRLGGDYYTLIFPNYNSLESQQTADLRRELVGDKVLNSNNLSGTFGSTTKLPLDIKLDLGYIYTLRNYTDQTIVLQSGLLSTEKREDIMYLGTLSILAPVIKKDTFKIIASYDDIFTTNDSNQNHYDARKTTFVEDYYDYQSNYFAPAVTFLLGKKPYAITVSYGLEKKGYKNRPVQDKNGTYDLTCNIWSETQFGTVSFIYPISEGFKLKAQTTYLWERSNMAYQELFTYIYDSANYLLGFSYEY
ncbi:MAG: hypothetical protein AB1349_06905 [Elusimicrobiota bacterium]